MKFNPFTGNFDYSGGSSDSSALGDKHVRTTRFEIINSGTSGSVTLPGSSTVVLDDFGGTVDAVISQVQSEKPMVQPARTSSDEVVATSFDSSGNWVLTGTPTSYPIAIIYRVRQKLSDFDSTATNIWGVSTVEGSPVLSVAGKIGTVVLDKNDVSLGNVDNTSDVNKPISTATQAVLDIKDRIKNEQFNRVFVDFISLTEGNTVQAISGGTFTHQPAGVNATENNVIGGARLSVTNSTDRAGFYVGSSSGMMTFFIGNGSGTEFSTSGRLSYTTNIPDGTNTTKFYYGLCDTPTGGAASEPAEFIGFRHDPTVNSGKIQAVIRSGSTDTEVFDTGHTPVVNVNDILNLTVSSSGVARFYVNGTLIATSTVTLPTPTTLLGLIAKLLKTAGSTLRICTFDWYDYEYSRSTPR